MSSISNESWASINWIVWATHALTSNRCCTNDWNSKVAFRSQVCSVNSTKMRIRRKKVVNLSRSLRNREIFAIILPSIIVLADSIIPFGIWLWWLFLMFLSRVFRCAVPSGGNCCTPSGDVWWVGVTTGMPRPLISFCGDERQILLLRPMETNSNRF